LVSGVQGDEVNARIMYAGLAGGCTRARGGNPPLAKRLWQIDCSPLRKGGKRLRKLAWAVNVGAGSGSHGRAVAAGHGQPKPALDENVRRLNK
jgi:hypothetical protein